MGAYNVRNVIGVNAVNIKVGGAMDEGTTVNYTTDECEVNSTTRYLNMKEYGLVDNFILRGPIDEIINSFQKVKHELEKSGFYDIEVYPSYDSITCIYCKREVTREEVEKKVAKKVKEIEKLKSKITKIEAEIKTMNGGKA